MMLNLDHMILDCLKLPKVHLGEGMKASNHIILDSARALSSDGSLEC